MKKRTCGRYGVLGILPAAVILSAILHLGGCKGKVDALPETKTLTVCVDETLYNGMPGLWYDYSMRHQDVELSFEIIPNSELREEERERVVSRLRAEIMAGGGPDVFLLDAGIYTECFFPNITKTMQSGVFYDLTEPLMAAGVDLDDYAAPLMAAGQLDGIQYIVPLRYRVETVVTNDAVTASLDEDFLTDPSALMAGIREVYSRTEAGAPIFMVGDSKDWLVYRFNPYYYDSSPVDYDGKTAEIDTPLTRLMMTVGREVIQKSKFTGKIDIDEYRAYAASDYYLKYYPEFSDAQYEAACIDWLGGEPKVYAVPTAAGETAAVIASFACIRNTSENKRNAVNLIKLCFEETAQLSRYVEYLGWASYGYPVDRQVLPLFVHAFSYTGNTFRFRFGEVGSVPTYHRLSEGVAAQFVDVATQVTTAVYPPPGEIAAIMNSYYAGEIDLDTCIDRMQAYWNLSLSE